MNATAPPHDVKRHHWIVRATHWVNVIALTIMVGSGLRIFNAYPGFARKGESFCCWPWEGTAIPGWLTFGGWLAGARHWHFAMMWVLAVNGFVYLAFVYLHGEWRDLVPRRGDPRDAWEMIKFYLFIRKRHPHQGKHNAMQKVVYFVLPWLGVLAVLTGLAIWKPVTLAPLTNLFGGYAFARYWHFMTMVALVGLASAHVFMVFAVDPQSLRSMVTGRYDESRSPEALNARPFLRDRPAPVLKIHRPASPDPAVASPTVAAEREEARRVEPAPAEDPRESVDAPMHPVAMAESEEAREMKVPRVEAPPDAVDAPTHPVAVQAGRDDGDRGMEDGNAAEGPARETTTDDARREEDGR